MTERQPIEINARGMRIRQIEPQVVEKLESQLNSGPLTDSYKQLEDVEMGFFAIENNDKLVGIAFAADRGDGNFELGTWQYGEIGLSYVSEAVARLGDELISHSSNRVFSLVWVFDYTSASEFQKRGYRRSKINAINPAYNIYEKTTSSK